MGFQLLLPVVFRQSVETGIVQNFSVRLVVTNSQPMFQKDARVNARLGCQRTACDRKVVVAREQKNAKEKTRSAT